MDYERIEQSGTWAAAMTAALDGRPLARPFLLAMWYAAWKQVPCGSLPADDREMAGAIGLPTAVFDEYRDVLLRGWWLAEDGRLYHDTLTARVVEMLGHKEHERLRKAGWRARQSQDVPRDTAGTTAGQTRESQGKDDTGTGTYLQKDKPSVEARARATRKCPADFSVSEDMREWAEREAPQVPVERETAKFRDHTFKTAIKDWPGAWRNWIRRAAESPAHRSGAPPSETPYARQMRERTSVLGPGVAAKAPGQPSHLTVIDADGTDQQKRLA